ncbi:MAG: trypsin-like peptidase domain-containing protein [Ignavibacteriae bacterium]|nr:trypsin-like peptidase domain-containing protein [Ignavibacteriota bacterium]
MRHTLCLLLALCIGAPHMLPAQDVDNAVVKIFVTSAPVPVWQPWIPNQPEESSGTGFIIAGKRILTNAHVVNFATLIQVKRAGETKRVTARLEHVSHQADLAVLAVDDTTFFSGTAALEIGELPAVQQQVTIIGFPSGGDEISYSSGIVSRIEVQTYSHSGESLLAVQVDAPVNPGNSGGPAVSEGKVVGMAMMSSQSLQNTNYLIPSLLIRHFLVDMRDGRVDGFPNLPIGAQYLENPMQREYLGLPPDGDLGILVADIPFLENHSSQLQRGDIILAIDGHAVHSNGKVELRPKTLVSSSHLLNMFQAGDLAQLTVLRNGREVKLRETLPVPVPLVPARSFSRTPPYIIVAGLVFIQHNRALYEGWQNYDAPAYHQRHDWKHRTEQVRDIVVLSRVLAHERNAGYANTWLSVTHVNGTAVKSFIHFVELVDASSRWLRITFDDNSQYVIDKNIAGKVNQKVLEMYGIPGDRSKSL